MIKEKKETILQLGAKKIISCLEPDFFQVVRATLYTLCLYIYTWFHVFRDKIFFSLVPCYYRLSLLQTLNLPPRLSAITRADCKGLTDMKYHQYVKQSLPRVRKLNTIVTSTFLSFVWCLKKSIWLLKALFHLKFQGKYKLF